MKKLLAILASLAVCCTTFAACSDGDTSSLADTSADSSSTADSSSAVTSADSSSAADTSSEADSSSESDTSSEPATSSEPDDSSEAPASTTPLDETVGDKAEFDSAPFEMFDKVANAQKHTMTAEMSVGMEDFSFTMSVIEVVDGDNAYSAETDYIMDEESTLAYLRLNGKSYVIDHDEKVYFEELEPSSVEEVIYDTDFAGLADMLNEGNDPKNTEVNNVTVDGKEYVRYAFVTDGVQIYMYASDGKPVMLSAEEDGTTMTVTFTRIEDTADKEYLKIPEGFAQTTAAEYYGDVE